MKNRIMALVLVLLVGAPVCLWAQESLDLPKTLVGRWEGEFQKESHDRFNNRRVLSIGDVEHVGDSWVVRNVRFAGNPVEATLDVHDGVPTIEFQTGIGNPVKLTLKDGDLIGMISIRGVAKNSTPVRPMRLHKVKA